MVGVPEKAELVDMSRFRRDACTIRNFHNHGSLLDENALGRRRVRVENLVANGELQRLQRVRELRQVVRVESSETGYAVEPLRPVREGVRCSQGLDPPQQIALQRPQDAVRDARHRGATRRVMDERELSHLVPRSEVPSELSVNGDLELTLLDDVHLVAPLALGHEDEALVRSLSLGAAQEIRDLVSAVAVPEEEEGLQRRLDQRLDLLGKVDGPRQARQRRLRAVCRDLVADAGVVEDGAPPAEDRQAVAPLLPRLACRRRLAVVVLAAGLARGGPVGVVDPLEIPQIKAPAHLPGRLRVGRGTAGAAPSPNGPQHQLGVHRGQEVRRVPVVALLLRLAFAVCFPRRIYCLAVVGLLLQVFLARGLVNFGLLGLFSPFGPLASSTDSAAHRDA
eukprot:scaffold1642_cov252-Pinguiococcus_pyrenoidosus.AAC.19